MSEPIMVNVTVTFQSGTTPGFTYSHGPAEGVEFSGTPSAHATLSGPRNWAFIFELAGSGVGQTLVWDTPAIIWMSGMPPTMEPEFILPTPSANQVVFGVHNNNTTPNHKEHFGFRLKVIDHGEHVESPDPEIILDPP